MLSPRAALRASEAVISTSRDARADADLAHHLTELAALHGHSFPSAVGIDVVPEITVILDPSPGDDSTYSFDLPGMRAIQPFKAAAFADLIVTFRIDRVRTSAVASRMRRDDPAGFSTELAWLKATGARSCCAQLRGTPASRGKPRSAPDTRPRTFPQANAMSAPKPQVSGLPTSGPRRSTTSRPVKL